MEPSPRCGPSILAMAIMHLCGGSTTFTMCANVSSPKRLGLRCLGRMNQEAETLTPQALRRGRRYHYPKL